MSIVVDRLVNTASWGSGEIDRSEEVRAHFRQVGDRLFAEPVSESVPNFVTEGDQHGLTELVKTCTGLGIKGAETRPSLLRLG